MKHQLVLANRIIEDAKRKIEAIYKRPVNLEFTIGLETIHLRTVAHFVTLHFGISWIRIKSDSSTQDVTNARPAFCWYAYRWCNESYEDIGSMINRTPQTIFYAVEKVDKLILDEDELSQDIEAIGERLRTTLLKQNENKTFLQPIPGSVRPVETIGGNAVSKNNGRQISSHTDDLRISKIV